MKTSRTGLVGMLWALLVMCGWSVAPVVAAPEYGVEAKWFLCPMVGMLDFEGDEEVDDSFLFGVRLGYDYSEWWTVEGEVNYSPKLKERFRTEWSTGEQVSRLEEVAGEGVHDVTAFSVSVDNLFHFTRWERLDPYIGFGVGVRSYSEKLSDGRTDPALRVGAGVMYHFNDMWAVRVDGRAFVAGKGNTEANSVLDAGVVWYWGARVAPKIVAVSGPEDSDGDRLRDLAEQNQYHTDPYNPDTDADGLQDGDEVLVYGSNPLDPDTDLDSLRDGEEVKNYRTNPVLRDTDNGGVSDGHEVREDGTDPLNPKDDLQLFELNVQFDKDQSIIRAESFGELDVVVKTLVRKPTTSVRIEGHADRSRLSEEKYNLNLSQRRAEAVLRYFVDKGVAEGRLKAVGYGFSRPKLPNDPVNGNPANRRVEIYVREGGAPESGTESALPTQTPAAPEAPASVLPETK